MYQNSVFASPPNSAAIAAGGCTCSESFSSSVQKFDEQRETRTARNVAEDLGAMRRPEVVQGPSLEWPGIDDALRFRSIHDFPRFSDSNARRERLGKE